MKMHRVKSAAIGAVILLLVFSMTVWAESLTVDGSDIFIVDGTVVLRGGSGDQEHPTKKSILEALKKVAGKKGCRVDLVMDDGVITGYAYSPGEGGCP